MELRELFPLDMLRWSRDRSKLIKAVHGRLRDPYYGALNLFYPHGIPVELACGYHVRLHSRLLGMRPDLYEPVVSAVLRQKVRQGMTVLDVGAHLGLHTLWLSQHVSKDGRVIAIEASPANARLLRTHLHWNGCNNVTLVEAAVGEKSGVIEFAFREDPTDPGAFANSVAYEICNNKALVSVNTLDEICRNLSPDLIKIDIEGAELLAVRGAVETLKRSSPALIVAFHPDAMQLLRTDPSELIFFMKGLGYSGRHLDGRPADQPGFEEIIFERLSHA